MSAPVRASIAAGAQDFDQIIGIERLHQVLIEAG
jgi:hypothetical protein